jgi:hypothetical protein
MMKKLSFLLLFSLASYLPGQRPSPKPSSRPASQPVVQEKPKREQEKRIPAKKQLPSKPSQPSSKPASRPSKSGKKVSKTKEKAGAKVEVKIEGKLVEPGQKKVPIPDGASEGDIRAIRGANAMLRVEKKLPKILKKMKIKGGVPFLPFEKIDAWPYEDGFKGMPKALKKWDKKRVVMAGFMFPIDEVEDIHEFFLVKSLWSCCYGTPPDVNGLVKVVIKGKKGIPYYYDPIFLVGTFHLKKVLDEDFCVAIYEMEAEVVKVLDM